MVTLYDLGISISFVVGNSKISVENVAESEKDYDSKLNNLLFCLESMKMYRWNLHLCLIKIVYILME